MARKKRGELGNAIRNMRLRKQAEMQNNQESAPLAPASGMPERMEASPHVEQAQAGSRPHASHRGAHGHRTGK